MVSKEEFTEGLTAMKAPISKEELQLIIKFITEKPARSKLDYLAFAKGAEIPFPIREDMSCEVRTLELYSLNSHTCAYLVRNTFLLRFLHFPMKYRSLKNVCTVLLDPVDGLLADKMLAYFLFDLAFE